MQKKALSFLLASALCLGLAVPALADSSSVDGTHNVISGGPTQGIIDGDGTVWMWGYNYNNLLGISGDQFDYQAEDILRKPVGVMKDAASISFSDDECYAVLKTDGSLWMWGWNNEGEVGNGGEGFYCKYGQIYQITPVKILDDVASVSHGSHFTAAVKTDGSLWMWGINRAGQLGNGGAGNAENGGGPYQTVPLKVMDDVAAVSCGGSYVAAIKTDGSLWTWGSNDYGALGNGGAGNAEGEDGTVCQTVPVKIMDDVAAVNCGYYHAAAIKTDGSLWTWGINCHGELGNGYTGNEHDDVHDLFYQTVPVKVLDDVKVVSCGGSSTAAIKTDGSLWIFGDNPAAGLKTGAEVTVEIPGETFEMLAVPTKAGDDMAVVDCQTAEIVAIKTDGTILGGYYTYSLPDGFTAMLPDGKAPQPAAPAISFSDVSDTAFYAESVAWAVKNGITNGTSEATFSPNKTCTQGEILTFLWRARGEPAPAGAVTGTEFYAKPAQWADEQSLTDAFNGDAPCTRAMVVTYLWKLDGSPEVKESDFTDVPAGADYAQAVAWAVEEGITNGTSATTFSPDKTCTRGEIVTFLYRALAQ